MALKIVKGTLERVLDKNLQDLVRGIRNHKDNEVCVFKVLFLISCKLLLINRIIRIG